MSHLENVWQKSPRFGRINRILPSRHLSKFREVFFSLPRKLSTLLCYLITNHNPLHHHLHRIGKSPSLMCRRYHQHTETTDHFLFHCRAHTAARTSLARDRLTLGKLLTTPKRIAALFTYIRTTARFDRTLGPIPEWEPPDT
ncbi:hypothetical protein BDQ17DRAFT_1517913 [Cyathus striatus]|nr:hypothetical protein BDQ17DRAFT_1517913 [Cyathus striatus]